MLVGDMFYEAFQSCIWQFSWQLTLPLTLFLKFCIVNDLHLWKLTVTAKFFYKCFNDNFKRRTPKKNFGGKLLKLSCFFFTIVFLIVYNSQQYTNCGYYDILSIQAKPFFCYFCLLKSQHCYTMKISFAMIF